MNLSERYIVLIVLFLTFGKFKIFQNKKGENLYNIIYQKPNN